MSKNAMKVFSGTAMRAGQPAPVVVAAKSRKMVIEALDAAGLALDVSANTKPEYWVNVIRRHWSEADPSVAYEAVVAAPGSVFLVEAQSSSGAVRLKQVPVLPGKTVPASTTASRSLPQAQRRQKSDAEKKERGETRLNTWIPPEATEALRTLTQGSEDRGVIRKALTEALVGYAKLCSKPKATR